MIDKKEIFSIPNILCYLRILLVPIFVYTFFIFEKDTHYISVVILTVSSITDFLDGYIARKYNMITELGKFIDPVADKLTQITVAIALIYKYPLYLWLAVIIFVKDLMLAIVGLVLLKKNGKHIDGAGMPGKIATCVFFIVSIVLLAVHVEIAIANILIYITIFLMFIAMVYYGRSLYKMFK